MTNYELWSLFFSGLSTMTTVIGVILALKQLRANYDIKEKEYKHSKMLAAKAILTDYRTLELGELIAHPELDYLNNNKRLSLEVILKAMENKVLKKQILSVLNYYESLASGINQQIYDEDVIKIARHGAMTRMVNAYQEYIDYRRNVENHPLAYLELTTWVEKHKPKASIKNSIF